MEYWSCKRVIYIYMCFHFDSQRYDKSCRFEYWNVHSITSWWYLSPTVDYCRSRSNIVISSTIINACRVVVFNTWLARINYGRIMWRRTVYATSGYRPKRLRARRVWKRYLTFSSVARRQYRYDLLVFGPIIVHECSFSQSPIWTRFYFFFHYTLENRVWKHDILLLLSQKSQQYSETL